MNRNLNTILQKTYSSFSQFEKELEKLEGTTDKGNAFEVFSKDYLKLNMELFQLDPDKVYLRNEIPTEIKKKLKFELTDYGVDGVYVRLDGKIVAFQAKFRSNRISPSFRELSTFWTESEYADMRLIITNANSLPKQTESRKNQLTVLGPDLDEIDDQFLLNWNELRLGRSINEVSTRKPVKPRPYQQKIIDDVLHHFKTHDRGKVIAACGIGKTLVSKWIQEGMNANNVIFMAPSLSLIKQTLEEWTSKTEQKISFLAVCSDESVISDAAAEEEADLTTPSVGFQVTTDPDTIKNFLESDTGRPKVIFSTYHSVDAIANALLLIPDFTFDLALYDEAHRTAGTKASKMFVWALDNNHISVEKRLFLTATERIVTPRAKKLAEKFEVDVFSMDDSEKYGIKFSELNFGDAIKQKIIADYKIVVCAMEEEELLEMLTSQNIDVTLDVGDTEKMSKIDILMKQIILSKAINQLGIRKVISYHKRVKLADEFINGNDAQPSFLDTFGLIPSNIPDHSVFTRLVSGEMSASTRRDILKDFAASPYGVLSNAKVLTEGIDVPQIDAVFFADPKESTIDIIQAVGRALRQPTGENKDKTAFILLPVVIPKDAETFGGINIEAFDTLHSVIQALRDQDEELAQIIDDINLGSGSNENNKPDDNLEDTFKGKLTLLNKINIGDFETALQFRISDVNRHNSYFQTEKPKDRSSGIGKRIFTSMGDYNITAYGDLVIPTLELFENPQVEYTTASIKLNNNNISHTLRLGAIESVKKSRYRLTPLGLYLKNNPHKFQEVFTRQMILFYKHDNDQYLFPYRALFKVLSQVDYLRKFDFVYCLYPMKNTSAENIEKVIQSIRYLQETYPDRQLDLLSEQNKIKVQETLNERFDVNLGYNDVWTSRGTAYNQFNYFFRHLSVYNNLFLKGPEKHRIRKLNGTRSHLKSILDATEWIEELAFVQNLSSDELWSKYTTSL